MTALSHRLRFPPLPVSATLELTVPPLPNLNFTYWKLSGGTKWYGVRARSSLSPYLDHGLFVLDRTGEENKIRRSRMNWNSDIKRTLFALICCPPPPGCISMCLCSYLGMFKLMLIPESVRKGHSFHSTAEWKRAAWKMTQPKKIWGENRPHVISTRQLELYSRAAQT